MTKHTAAGLDVFQTFNEVGLAVKRSTSGHQQPWLSSSPIDGNFYFIEAAPAANTPLANTNPSSINEAAQAWNATKDTKNPAILEAFIQRYSASFFANLARARLDELKVAATQASPQIATITPWVQPTNPPPPQAAGSSLSRQRVVLYDEDPSDA